MVRLPRCVLFDLDGTILDSLPGIESSVRAAFAGCDLPVPQGSLREIVGPPIRTILARVGSVQDESILDALELAFRRDYDSEGWQQTACFPGAVRVLREMRERGFRLFVISNKPSQISVRILEREEILDIFEAIVTRDSRLPAYSGKEEMIRDVLTGRGMGPEDCAMVGDTIDDAEAAAAVGIPFIHMAHGYGTVDVASVPVSCRLENFLQFMPLAAEELV